MDESGCFDLEFLKVLAPWATVIVTVLLWTCDKRAARHQEILKLRSEAMMGALEVIDHVLANEKILPNGGIPSPHQWDLSKARNAMNKIIVYCKKPKRALEVFRDALGIHEAGKPSTGVNLGKLVEFRQVVTEELGLPKSTFVDEKFIWISTLAGGK